MLKHIFTLGLGLVIFMISGCATSDTKGGGVETRAYVADKDRLDQDMEGGNYGYLFGNPVAPDRSSLKKTRKVYVLEFTKNPEIEPEDIKVETPPPAPVTINVPERRPPTRQPEPEEQPFSLPSFDEPEATVRETPEPEAEVSFTEYQIQKGDTLQKISKQFYNSYSKWSRIYDANKDVIKDPNRLKVGVKLRIPQ